MKHYKQLTHEQRCQIYALKKTKMSQQETADSVGVSQSAISREFKRNTGGNGYQIKQAQRKAKNRRSEACKATKMTPSMVALVESMLRKKLSPEQISGWLLGEHEEPLNHETIYRHIWADKMAGGDLYTELRRRGKAYQPRSKSQAGRGHIKNRVSIDERAEIVEAKTRVSDWEIDLVIGKGHSGALVTIVDRATSFTISKRINNKMAQTITGATIDLLRPFKGAVLTITSDNGKEFAYHEQMTETLGAQVYFAEPYCSWQRDLNENTNGLLRQYWPKKTDFKEVSAKEVKDVIVQLNDRPRKKLNFKTPAKLMADHIAAIAA